jgi:DNA-binding CsgD family transcriptional regulator
LSLKSDTSQNQIVVAVSVADPALADRLTSLLAGVPGLRLAAAGEHGDVVVTEGEGSHIRDGFEPALTPREVEVLSLLAEGVSNKAIAQQLGISVHTAKFHVGQVIDKLDATGRTDAVAHAARLGILHL